MIENVTGFISQLNAWQTQDHSAAPLDPKITLITTGRPWGVDEAESTPEHTS